MTRKHYSPQQQHQHIQAWQQSGLTKCAYASLAGINIKTFANWARRTATPPNATAFIPARLTSPEAPLTGTPLPAASGSAADTATLYLPAGGSVTARPAALVDIIRRLNLC